MEPEQWIYTVLRHAESLRAAGVLSIGPGSATFASAVPIITPVNDSKPDLVEFEVDALHDPASYPGGVVPGFEIEKLDEGDF